LDATRAPTPSRARKSSLRMAGKTNRVEVSFARNSKEIPRNL
jgi:hypothetical protein